MRIRGYKQGGKPPRELHDDPGESDRREQPGLPEVETREADRARDGKQPVARSLQCARQEAHLPESGESDREQNPRADAAKLEPGLEIDVVGTTATRPSSGLSGFPRLA